MAQIHEGTAALVVVNRANLFLNVVHVCSYNVFLQMSPNLVQWILNLYETCLKEKNKTSTITLSSPPKWPSMSLFDDFLI